MGIVIGLVMAGLQLKNTKEPIRTKTQVVETEVKGVEVPVDRANLRVTKKKFGQYITAKNSPVQPEKFGGYHTGTDFEIFPDEAEKPVEVRAICDGRLELKKTATGYGGVAVQSCMYHDQQVTVIYGHLKLSSVGRLVGEEIKYAEVIGILGKGFSVETDGERKHLHLGIHKGSRIDVRGYVDSKSMLSEWLDIPY